MALVHHVHREQWRIIYPGVGGRIGWFVESRVVPWLYRDVPFVTVSEASRRDLLALGLADVTVVRNGTPALAAPRLTRSATPRLCVLSRLVPHKRIEQALALVDELRGRHPGLVLDLVGDGWWAPELDAEIARRGLGDSVVRHGRVDEQTKADLLAQAWLMVLPSIREGWGIAVLEAAAVGVPTVAYAGAGGTSESVLHGPDRGAGRRRGRAGRGGRRAARGSRAAGTPRCGGARTGRHVHVGRGLSGPRDGPAEGLLAVDEGGLLGRVLVRAGRLRLHETEHHQEGQDQRR